MSQKPKIYNMPDICILGAAVSDAMMSTSDTGSLEDYDKVPIVWED